MTPMWTLDAELDRAGDLRSDEQQLARAWSSPEARLVRVDGGGLVETSPVMPQEDLSPDEHVLLGTSEQQSRTLFWFARRAVLDESFERHDLRRAELTTLQREVGSAAVAVLAWHDTHLVCARCGGATRMGTGGFHRVCQACGRQLFPRTDPAMITAVLDADDRLLLAHQATWTPGRVSLLAGFLEAGESAEHAVVREVMEEVGIHVTATRYLASQPWPFPRSLMLGFVSRGNGEPVVDGVEIGWARWFTRDGYRDALVRGEITRPNPNSIAARIIDLWLDGRLPQPEENQLVG